MTQETADENAVGSLRICKRSDQSKIETLQCAQTLITFFDAESLTGHRHDKDRVQTEGQEFQPRTAVSTLLDLVSTV